EQQYQAERRSRSERRSRIERARVSPQPLAKAEIQDAEHGVGLQAEPTANFLKCELVTNRDVRFCGSSTTVVTTSHASPFASVVRVMYSVSRACALAGAT